MYDTRHRIFQFAVALNTALLGVVFQFVPSNTGRFLLSLLGLMVTLAMVLMAKRSGRFTNTVETYAMELEEKLGFGLVRQTAARMPKGIGSSRYLYFVYWMLVATWVVLGVYFLMQL